MAAINSCEPKQKKGAWQEGASMYEVSPMCPKAHSSLFSPQIRAGYEIQSVLGMRLGTSFERGKASACHARTGQIQLILERTPALKQGRWRADARWASPCVLVALSDHRPHRHSNSGHSRKGTCFVSSRRELPRTLHIEYIRETYGGNDEQRREFLVDAKACGLGPLTAWEQVSAGAATLDFREDFIDDGVLRHRLAQRGVQPLQ
jgi:hypothetical protein